MKKKELALKIFYFLLFAQIGVFTPYIAIFYTESVGLTGSQIGFLMAISTLLASFFQFFWGYVSDRSGNTHLIMIICIIINIVQFFQAFQNKRSSYREGNDPEGYIGDN